MQHINQIAAKPFRIKICGITSVEDALLVASAGGDAVGLNFYRRSPRCVAHSVARTIVDRLPDHVVKVGVFVNAPVEEIVPVCSDLGLDWVQLHGDEPPDVVARLHPLPVIRVFRLQDDSIDPVAAYLTACRHVGYPPRMVLIDAFLPSQYGGTGNVADWGAAARCARNPDWPPVVLAGGLTADNVAEAIRAAAPSAVDTASGVEESPGKKHPEKTRRFVQQAKQAFASPG